MAMLPKHRSVYVDAGCVLFVGLVVLLLEVVPSAAVRGFFCDDESIRYPYVRQTINTLTLVLVSFITPIVVFFTVEALRLLDTTTPRDSWHSLSTSVLRNLYETYGIFIFGAGLNQVTVDVGKYSVGRLRPHFLDVCKPTYACPDTGSSRTYITDYTCSGDPAVIEEGRLSFPSGHAALAFYTAIYISMFLQQRLRWGSTRLPRHLTQAALVMFAWFTALSRVRDYYHHPGDVAAGIAIGTAWALIMTCFVVDLRIDTSNATKDELRSIRTDKDFRDQGMNSV